jgi:hypothetical protein
MAPGKWAPGMGREDRHGGFAPVAVATDAAPDAGKKDENGDDNDNNLHRR